MIIEYHWTFQHILDMISASLNISAYLWYDLRSYITEHFNGEVNSYPKAVLRFWAWKWCSYICLCLFWMFTCWFEIMIWIQWNVKMYFQKNWLQKSLFCPTLEWIHECVIKNFSFLTVLLHNFNISWPPSGGVFTTCLINFCSAKMQSLWICILKIATLQQTNISLRKRQECSNIGKQHGLAAVWNKTFPDKLLSIEFDKKLFRVLDALDREILRTFIALSFCNVMVLGLVLKWSSIKILLLGRCRLLTQDWENPVLGSST